MVPAYGMVFLPQNPSTSNGKIPGCSCILSLAWLDLVAEGAHALLSLQLLPQRVGIHQPDDVWPAAGILAQNV